MFWKNSLLEINKNKVLVEIIKKSKSFDINLKKLDKYIIEKENRDNILNKNIENFRKKINKDVDDLDIKNNWSSYKKKIEIKIKPLNFGYKFKKPMSIIGFKKNLINLIEKNLLNYLMIRFYKNINILSIYTRINLQRIENIKKINYFQSFENKIIIIVDFRGLKNKIIVMNFNRCIAFITPGIIFKKLNMDQKKSKKSEKIIFIMIKSIFLKINKEHKYNKSLIYIKGLRKNSSNLINFLCKNIKSKKNTFIFSNKISLNKLKFKKIKSIKRRLKKKNIQNSNKMVK